jgi:hypothetical protein
MAQMPRTTAASAIGAKERGRFVELFYLQAEKGDGITAPLIDLAMKSP